MEYVSRAAIPDDAPCIAAVAESAWPEEPLDADAIASLIAEPMRGTHVAVQDHAIVGFVDGFITRASDGAPRWEVDLLAVSPRAQGRGIGRGLVAASVAAGDAMGVRRARSLIRTGNVGSERAFAACGFRPDPFESELWVAEGLAMVGQPAGLHVVPVRTLRYRGIWLEDATAQSIRALGPHADAGVAGAIIPLAESDTLRTAAEVGLELAGRFRFWRHAMGT